jgi:phage terminase small subunit
VAGRKKGRPASRGGATGLSDRERIFVARYLTDRNVATASSACGISRQAGALYLQREHVQRAIEDKVVELEHAAEVTAELVLLELKGILLTDPAGALSPNGAVLPLREWPEDLRRALSSIDVEEIWEGRGVDRSQVGEVKKLRFWSKTEAAQQLLRVLGEFKDKVELTHKTHAEMMLEVERRAKELKKGEK